MVGVARRSVAQDPAATNQLPRVLRRGGSPEALLSGGSMKPTFITIYRLYGRLLAAMAVVAGLAMFVMMWLVGLNSLTRKLFNAPVVGTVEITEALMSFAIMLPMAYTQLKRGHIRVTLLVSRLTPAVAHILYAVALLLGCLLFAWATGAAFRNALRS